MTTAVDLELLAAALRTALLSSDSPELAERYRVIRSTLPVDDAAGELRAILILIAFAVFDDSDGSGP